jgi:hypothetical protein
MFLKLEKAVVLAIAGAIVTGIGIMLLPETPVTSHWRVLVALMLPAGGVMVLTAFWLGLADSISRRFRKTK